MAVKTRSNNCIGLSKIFIQKMEQNGLCEIEKDFALLKCILYRTTENNIYFKILEFTLPTLKAGSSGN